MTRLRSRCGVVLLLGLSVMAGETVRAQLPPPSVTNVVASATNALWDVSYLQWADWMPLGFMDVLPEARVTFSRTNIGGTNFIVVRTNFVGSQTAAYFAAPFTQNGRGGLSGRGTNIIAFNTFYTSSNQWGTEVDFPGNYASSGSVSGVKGVTQLTLNSRASGRTLLDGKNRSIATSAGFVLFLSAASRSVSGSYANNILVTGRPTVSAGGLVGQLDLQSIPASLGDGSWTLIVNTTNSATGNRLSGSATITLATVPLPTGLTTNTVYSFSVKGTYLASGPSQGQSKLALLGVKTAASDARGSSLGVTLKGAEVVGMSGRVAGQAISLK